MSGEWPIDQPVELSIRGWYLDIIGAIAAFEQLGLDVENAVDPEGIDRTERVITDILDQVTRQVNVGYIERELKKAARAEDPPEYGGLQVDVREFDPRHPDPTPDIDHLSPLEDAEYYVVLMRTDEGFEAAGYPDSLGIEESMLLASFMRTYARDLEDELPEGEIGDREDD